jgi:hypothetical protein
MTEEEKIKVEKEVFKELTLALRFEGIDIRLLSKETINMIMIGFQTGIKYWAEVVDKRLK